MFLYVNSISRGITLIEGYQKDFPECPEYVLDVPQATAVLFSKKVKKIFTPMCIVIVRDWQLIEVLIPVCDIYILTGYAFVMLRTSLKSTYVLHFIIKNREFTQ